MRRDAVIGALIGAATGAAVVVGGRCGAFKDGIDGDCTSVETAATVGGALGAAAGFLIGGIVGAVRSGS